MSDELSFVVWKRLVIIQMTCASLSFMASSLVAIAILRNSDGGLKSPYRRIIFGISVSDILQSLSLLAGPFTIPSAAPQGRWAIGNYRTCQIDGFFFSFSAGSTPMYMFGLCLCTVLKIKRNMTDEVFTQKIEKVMHLLIILFNLIPCIVALATKSINGTYLGSVCAFSAFPTGCRQRPDLFGECDPAIADSAAVLALYSYLAMPILCLFGIIGCMGMICGHIFQTTRLPRRRNILLATRSESNSSASSDNESQNDTQDLQEIRRRQIESNLQESETMIRVYRRELILQACFVVLAFFTTFLFWWVTNITLLSGKQPSVFLLYAFALLYPLAGFFNVLLFARQKVSSFRIRHSEYSWFQALLLFIKAGGESPSMVDPSMESSITMTAWQINSTPFKVQDSIVNDLSVARQYLFHGAGSLQRI